MNRLAAILFASCLAVAASPSLAAGASAASGAPQEARFAPQKVAVFAKKVERAIAASGAHVALVARIGFPPGEMPPGMRFSHVGFAVYSSIAIDGGRTQPGYAMYNLYQDDANPSSSSLVRDYPADFFANAAVLESGVTIPSPELQKRILAVIASPTYAALHNPHYSVIANPYAHKTQNCTDFVLDVLNAAIYRTGDASAIEAAEKAYFVAQPVKIEPMKLALGALFMPDVSLADQNGAPVTATFERITDYLRRYDAGTRTFVVRAD